MAGSFSNYLENEVLDHVLKVGAYTQPTNIYVALYTAVPSDAGGGTEVSGSAYARAVCNSWSAASGGASANATVCTFPQASSADWGTVTAFGLFDALTSGNLLAWGTLTSAKTVEAGDTARFTTGELDVTLD